MQNPDLDAELLAWDSWCVERKSNDFDLFAKERELDESSRAELKRILEIGKDIGKIASSQTLEADSFTKDLLAREFRNRFDFSRQLGAGGMGSVWLAEQLQPIQRKVAVKLIRNDLVSDSMRQRFAFERQALASLAHPNIATVHEAGETEGGRPYFVMEYIPGEKITDYCNQQKVDLFSRLKLFLEVCDAIEHAHRRGLIHRDLKPGNVIVTEENGLAAVKVIDFGLAKHSAKVLGQESLTHTHAIVGSPMWMSPEQARVFDDGDEVQVDTRTDIYSLGVILYELLTNSSPLSEDFVKQSPPARVIEAIRFQLPLPPSQTLNENLDSAKNWLNNSTSSNFASWVGSLKDDLDWIVMKAIEKEPARRYGSITELINDLKRFIRGESVSARPPSRYYRFKKVVSRNRTLAAAIALATIALVAAACVSIQFAIKTNRALALAEQRLESSEQIISAFAGGLEVFSFDDSSAQNSQIKSDLLRGITERFNAILGPTPKNLPAKELARREYSWRNPLVLASKSAGLEEECLTQLRELIAILEPIVEPHDMRLVESRTNLSNLLIDLNRATEARSLAEENMLIVESIYQPNTRGYLISEVALLSATAPDRSIEENLARLQRVVKTVNVADDENGKFRIGVIRLAANLCSDEYQQRAQ